MTDRRHEVGLSAELLTASGLSLSDAELDAVHELYDWFNREREILAEIDVAGVEPMTICSVWIDSGDQS